MLAHALRRPLEGPIISADAATVGSHAMTCPICARAPAAAYRPFCSARCADVDLARWLTGSYAIPSQAPEDIEAAAQAVDEARGKPH